MFGRSCFSGDWVNHLMQVHPENPNSPPPRLSGSIFSIPSAKLTGGPRVIIANRINFPSAGSAEEPKIIDEDITVDDGLHGTSHSTRNLSMNFRLLSRLLFQIPKPMSCRFGADSLIISSTARRIASAREIFCASHSRARACSCASGKSTMVLND